MSFFIMCARNFAMINFDDFIIHTSRDRKYFLSFCWQVIVVNLKSHRFIQQILYEMSLTDHRLVVRLILAFCSRECEFLIHTFFRFFSIFSMFYSFCLLFYSFCLFVFVLSRDSSSISGWWFESYLSTFRDECRFARVNARFLLTCRDECRLVEMNTK